jgi:hypothetical protein
MFAACLGSVIENVVVARQSGGGYRQRSTFSGGGPVARSWWPSPQVCFRDPQGRDMYRICTKVLRA